MKFSFFFSPFMSWKKAKLPNRGYIIFILIYFIHLLNGCAASEAIQKYYSTSEFCRHFYIMAKVKRIKLKNRTSFDCGEKFDFDIFRSLFLSRFLS